MSLRESNCLQLQEIAITTDKICLRIILSGIECIENYLEHKIRTTVHCVLDLLRLKYFGIVLAIR